MRDKYPLVINLDIYPFIGQFSKYLNNRFQYIIMVFKKYDFFNKKKPKKHQFFGGSFMETVKFLRFLKSLESTIPWFWFFFQKQIKVF